MDISYYNEEVDKILFNIIGNDSFMGSELDNLVDTVSNTIYQYNKKITLAKLKLVVQYLIENKYQKYYEYDTNSEFNKVADTNIYIDSESSPKSKSEASPKTNSETSSNKNKEPIKSETLSNKNKEPIKSVTSKINTEVSPTKKSANVDSDIMSIDESDLIDVSNNDSDTNTVTYINSELGAEATDKVQLSSAKDLVSHRHDYLYDTFKEERYIRRQKRIVEIKRIPQFEQKSTGWLEQRGKCLTATAIATALDEDPYKTPAELLLDKCDRGVPFVENKNVHHGKKYEEIGNMFYSFRNNVIMYEYGLIQHDKHSFIGASPDGICEKKTLESDIILSSLVGRLLEIKFPKTRKILTEGDLDGDICPHYYYVQVQTQLFVTKMDECDFLQCQIDEYDSWEDFVKDSNPKIPGLSKISNLEKGCLIQLLPKKMVDGDPEMCLYNGRYLYPPRLHMSHDEIQLWIAKETIQFPQNNLSKNFMIDKVIYWRLSMVACNLIKADPEWFESKIPYLKQFWNYVLFYRKYPKKLDALVKYIEDVGNKKTADIFKRVHKDYLSVRTDSTYTPLYQEENEWRTKYNKKYERWNKFQDFKNNNSKKKSMVDV